MSFQQTLALFEQRCKAKEEKDAAAKAAADMAASEAKAGQEQEHGNEDEDDPMGDGEDGSLLAPSDMDTILPKMDGESEDDHATRKRKAVADLSGKLKGKAKAKIGKDKSKSKA